MSPTGLLEGCVSCLYSAQDPPHDRVHRVPLLRLSPERVVREAHWSDVLRARELAGGIGQVAYVRRDQVADSRRSRKREPRGPVVLAQLDREFGQQASASTKEDVGRKPVAASELLEAQGEALQQHLSIRAQQLRDLAMLIRRQQALGVAQLAGLSLLVAQSEG